MDDEPVAASGTEQSSGLEDPVEKEPEESKEKENDEIKEEEEVDGVELTPDLPASILKISEATIDESQAKKQRNGEAIAKKRWRKNKIKSEKTTQSKKLVPVWYLFRYAKVADIFLMIFGVLMAVASGLALPGHMIMFGEVIDLFISYDLSQSLLAQIRNRSLTLEEYLMPMENTGYFCNFTDEGQSNSSVVRYILANDSAGSQLQIDVAFYSLYYVVMATGAFVTSFLANSLMNTSAYRQTRRMRYAFFSKILQQEIGWFDVNPTGELNNRLSDDVEKIQSGIGDKAAFFLQSLTTFLAGFVIAFVYNWKLTLVMGTMLPVIAILGATLTRIIAKFTVIEQNAYATAGAVATEVLSSIRTVISFGGEHKAVARYRNFLKNAKYVGYRKGFFSALVIGLLQFVIFCTFALGLWYGSVLLTMCELRPGNIVTVLLAVIVGSFSLSNVLPELETFASALGSATAVFAVIDRTSEINSSSKEGIIPDKLSGDIEFRDVVFRYPARSDVQILHGIDLQIKVGETVALVGPSGCGKSTLIQLLQRFYDTNGGMVLIGGHDVRSLNLRWLRKNIGVVSQEPVLFNTTIAENIRYGKEDASMEDIEKAAREANAYDFISELPEGFNTQVGERGAQLSGGQKQRIAIARALVRNPKILLLDEATSALDNESEKVVQDALDKAREGRTTIVIAHRLSTIQTANVIVSIENGRVVEKGSHSELMKKKGLYYELVTAQTIVEEEEKEEAQAPLSDFRRAIFRTASSRVRSTSLSSSEGGFEHQVSTQSKGGEYLSALTDHLSRISMEDLPIGAHPSPLPTRRNKQAELSPDLFESVEYTTEVATITFDTEEDQVQLATKQSVRTVKNADEEVQEAEPVYKVSFLDLLKLNIPDWFLVIPGIITAALIGITFPTMAVLFSGFLESFGSTDVNALMSGSMVFGLSLIGLGTIAFCLLFTSTLTLQYAGERLTERLRFQTFQAMLRQEMGWFDRKENATGALTTRLATDASSVKGATGLRLSTLLQLLAGFIAAVVIAFEASWLLSIVLFICFPILALVGYAQIKLQQGRAAKNKHLIEESGKTTSEAIENIRTVASLAVEDKFIDLYEQLLIPPFKANIKNVFMQAMVFGLAQSFIFYVYGAGFSLGAVLVISPPDAVYHTEFDKVFRVFAAVIFTALSLGRASSFAPDAQKAQSSASRIFTLLQRKPEIDGYSDEGEKPESSTGEIALKGVHFSYPTRPSARVLQGLSVSVKPGQTLALVGPSGCGKSTVVSLVERFYDPLAGLLTLDGNDLKDLSIRWLRSQIGIVSQEPVLFDASIADNIRYGANFREVSDEEVVEAAKAANIHSFIETLPQGYSTNVGAKGTQMSGGQKQRVAIARALVRNPKILLLDEATSALDTESEKVVQEALDKAREGRTSIVIAHRLSTIYGADCIAVIHNGQVMEIGTHSELMSQGGAYFLLNTIQKAKEEEEETES